MVLDFVTNIIRIEGTPFKNPVKVFSYEAPSDYDFMKMGRVCRNIRKIDVNCHLPIIQSGLNLYSIDNLVDSEERWLKDFKTDSFELSADNENYNKILQHLLSESLAVHLRNKPDEKWIVGEIGNQVYEVKRWDQIQGFGPVITYPGFRFTALIRPNGEAGIILDPKYKLHSKYNLRELYIRGDRFVLDLFYSLPLSISDNRANVIDMCPVDQCEEKGNPSSVCRLAGSGTNARIIQVEKVTPSQIKINEQNLIEYHQNDSICIKGDRLANRIIDSEPVAEIQYYGGGVYSIPLERLRLTPTFDTLQGRDRHALMEKVRPNPSQRFLRTRAYAKSIDTFPFGNLFDLTPAELEKKWTSRSTERYSTVYKVGNNESVEFPEILIRKFGPADVEKQELRTLNMIVVHSEPKDVEMLSNISRLFCHDLEGIPNFGNYLQVKCKNHGLLRINRENMEQTLEQIENLHKSKDNFFVIVVHGPKGNNALLSDLKINLNQRGIPKQGINLDEFSKNIDSRRANYFRNVYLGVYTKIGGNPWLIASENAIDFNFLGLSTRTVSNSYYYSMCQYSGSAKFVKGKCSRLSEVKSSQEISDNLKLFIQPEKRNIILNTGVLKQHEKDAIDDLSRNMNEEIGSIEVISNSPIRLFGSRETDMQPETGICFWLSNREVALVTTDPPGGTANPILIRNVNLSDSKFQDSIPRIYDISQCYTGYTGFSLREPLPCYAANRTLSRFIEWNVQSLDFKRQWFV